MPSCLLLLTACYDSGNMNDQPRAEPLAPSDFFEDGTSARPLVPGTVPRGQEYLDEGIITGWRSGEPLERVPFEIDRNLLRRGQDRFSIYCTPCHALDGSGNGIIVQRGFTAPPTFHTQRLREVPDGYLFSVITDGFGRMASYAQQLEAEDRWAIVAYVRALQLSRHAPVEALPADLKDQLSTAP